MRAANGFPGAGALVSWSSFPGHGGTRLHSERCGLNSWRLVAEDGDVWVTQRLPSFYGPSKLRVGSKDYELRWITRRARPLQERHLVEVRSGRVVFRLVGNHFNRSASARVLLPGDECIEFPVQGSKRADATLQATDGAGRVLVSCRIDAPRFGGTFRKHLDVVVAPDAPETPTSALIASVAADLLLGFLSRPGGGA